MKLNKIIMSTLIVLSSSVFADEVTDVDADIATTTSVDELAQKMTQAKHQYRYRYMNAIKNQLATVKEEKRATKLESIMSHVQSAKAEQLGTLERSMNRSGNLNGLGGKNSGGGAGGNSGSNGGNGGSGGGNGGGRN